MRPGDTAFSTSVFSVDVAGVARHPNPVTCVVRGRRGPLSVVGQGQSVTGDIVIIRPGVEHHIICGEGGLSAMYLDGARWPGPGTLAERLEGRLGELALAGMKLDSGAQRELRERLDHGQDRLSRRIGAVLEDLAAEPMARMSQDELAKRLGLERTQALRLFKHSTGTTFRQFKRWTGLQHAARLIVAGARVRTAAMDAGFADTAHLTRTFKQCFGLTPSQAIAGLPTIGGG
ncbi:helix-turn-helix domain-containing protein [Bradyrhizobium jicamae]|uniref:helix-turn-helix domain-containing protein n=1 Tax=Bradyrhizobium jicamae TaxID=280332 RepID=UPI00070B75AA|nr:AraC family transcriptional regulator [Bradyrhizobium jicamae]